MPETFLNPTRFSRSRPLQIETIHQERDRPRPVQVVVVTQTRFRVCHLGFRGAGFRHMYVIVGPGAASIEVPLHVGSCRVPYLTMTFFFRFAA